jgi:hypothetical protein
VAGSSSDTENTCGEGSAGWSRVAPVKLPSLTQEPNTLSPLVGENGKFWRTVWYREYRSACRYASLQSDVTY